MGKATLSLRRFDPTGGDKTNTVRSLINVARQVNKRVKHRRGRKKPEIVELGGVIWVPANQLFINYHAQRWPLPKHIKNKLIAQWNPYYATPLYCRKDPKTDRYYIVDGQQHAIAWVIIHGEKTLLPVTFVQAPSSVVEHGMFRTVNNSPAKIELHDIHLQDVRDNVSPAKDIEKILKRAGCHTGYYFHKTAGCITHVKKLYDCYEKYGGALLESALKHHVSYFPSKKLDGGMFAAMLKVEKTLIDEGIDTADVIEDLWSDCGKYFDTGADCVEACKDPITKKLKKLGAKMEEVEKAACGLMSMYNKLHGESYGAELIHNDLDVPIMNPSYGLYAYFESKTYGTREIYNEICETGDITLAWAYLAGRENYLTDASDIETLHGMCEESCVDCGVELDYGRGRNGEGKAEENRPSVAHDQSVAKTNDFSIDNIRGVICTTCNRRESDNPNYVPDLEITKEETELA